MSEFLGIDIKTLDNGVFHIYQPRLVRKVLESTGMDHFNGLPTTTNVEAPIGTDENGSEATWDLPNSHAYVIGIILYLASNTRTYISFDIKQCTRFTNNTKESHETSVKRICRYLQGIKYKSLVFNTPKKMVVDCYAGAYFARLWGHENLQDPICYRIRTTFVINVSNCPLLWMSKRHIDIYLSTLHSDYVELYNYVRRLLPLKIPIKEVI